MYAVFHSNDKPYREIPVSGEKLLAVCGAAIGLEIARISSIEDYIGRPVAQLFEPTFHAHPDFGRRDYIPHHNYPKNTIRCSSKRKARSCKKSNKLKKRRRK